MLYLNTHTWVLKDKSIHYSLLYYSHTRIPSDWSELTLWINLNGQKKKGLVGTGTKAGSDDGPYLKINLPLASLDRTEKSHPSLLEFYNIYSIKYTLPPPHPSFHPSVIPNGIVLIKLYHVLNEYTIFFELSPSSF